MQDNSASVYVLIFRYPTTWSYEASALEDTAGSIAQEKGAQGNPVTRRSSKALLVSPND